MDGSDEERLDEVRGVIDELWSRRLLDEAGVPKIEKRKTDSGGAQFGQSIEEDDLEGGPAD